MSPQAKGMQIGGAIAVAMCAAFLVRWWMMPAGDAWALSEDGGAWEATRDSNGARLLPTRRYALHGSGTAPAQVTWSLVPTDVDNAPPRVGAAGRVEPGDWTLVFSCGTDAPRRALASVRVSPASAVRPESLRIELAR
jgi:hypothetical protein